ncbi:RluA family pseudouridine synthase [Tindallia californiensis]|uniref:Pseudouridine synthase n=1 Tax=Tindallia californiensis TaxID=159292 RepID=A0A1H3JMG0_9FIRM|nr:RluA family pseudouridine synthase [Tindallia californiensis]SDY41170.1 ribosomal large subunit pseudouridine synthase D [Tindallia californiensis]
MGKKQFKAEEHHDGIRLDQFLVTQMEEHSRSFLQKCIKEHKVLVNDRIQKNRHVIKKGDIISVDLVEPEELQVEAENIPIDIVYEDDFLVVVNKPQNLVVHPSAGHWQGTLVNALLFHCKEGLSGINGIIRPGIVHRIDKDTSGLLVVAKTDQAHKHLAKQLSEHTMLRSYKAVVRGIIEEDELKIDAPIGRHKVQRKKMAVVKEGKPAITNIKVLQRYKNHTLIHASLETGRTHQIRVHMAYSGHPVVGDELYSRPEKHFNLKGQALHAYELGFVHPETNKLVHFNAPLPPYFEALLKMI